MQKVLKSSTKKDFVCGECLNNEDGFCDLLGLFVEDDDSPHCTFGSGWETKRRMEDDRR